MTMATKFGDGVIYHQEVQCIKPHDDIRPGTLDLVYTLDL